MTAFNHHVEWTPDSHLACVVDHVLKLVLSFYLFVKYTKGNILHEDNPLLFALEEYFLLNHTNQELLGELISNNLKDLTTPECGQRLDKAHRFVLLLVLLLDGML